MPLMREEADLHAAPPKDVNTTASTSAVTGSAKTWRKPVRQAVRKQTAGMAIRAGDEADGDGRAASQRAGQPATARGRTPRS